MNHITLDPLTINFGCVCLGVFLGVIIHSFLQGAKEGEPLHFQMGEMDGGQERRKYIPHPDTVLLDSLEQSENNVYFNDNFESGMWGVLNKENKLLATGHTVRMALKRASVLELEKALDEIGNGLMTADGAPGHEVSNG